MVMEKVSKEIKAWVSGWANARFFAQRVYQKIRNGNSSAGLPFLLNDAGYVDSSFLNIATLTDANFTLVDDADATKKFKLQLSSIGSGATRTWTVPNFSDTFVGTTGTQTLDNKTLLLPTIAANGFTNANHLHTGDTGGHQLDHTAALTNVGSNTHAQIDTHIAATAAHGATGAVVGTTNTQALSGKTIRTSSNAIADDDFFVFDPGVTTGIIVLGAGTGGETTVGGLFFYRATSTPHCVSLASASNTNVTTGALTGTTGTDTKFTVSVATDGKLYFENRRGASRTVTILVIL